MNRIDRLTSILIQLQSKRIIKAKEIAQRFGISLRTVYRDIRTLEEAGVPIGSDAGVGYYLIEGYNLPPLMFTTEEAGALILAEKLIENFSDRDLKKHFDSALYKIKAILNDRDKDYINDLQNKIGVYKPTKTTEASEYNYLASIQAALRKNSVISIEYHSYKNSEPTIRSIEPITLSLYESHWYLIAYCRLRNSYRNFRIDRITKMSTTDEAFDRKKHGSLQEVLKEMLTSVHLHKVTLRFEKNAQYNTILNRCCLGLVEEKDLENKIEITLSVDSLQVLGKWLLDYGKDVEIIGPSELKIVMQQYAIEIANQYLSESIPDSV